MRTKFIELADGTLVQVETSEEDAQQISASFADRVDAQLDNIKPLLIKVARPIAAAWREINQDMNIEQAEIELGLGFEGEGNLYVTKSKVSANLTVKLILKPAE